MSQGRVGDQAQELLRMLRPARRTTVTLHLDLTTTDVDHAAALSALLAVARRLPTAAVERLATDAAGML